MRRPLIALLALSVFPASAAAVTSPDRIGPADGNFDVRTVRAVPPDHAAAVAGLRARLGADGIVSVDARNGALRQVGRLNGFLTGPSPADPARVALGFVRRNRAAFGLTPADIDGLVLVRRVRSGDGLQRLFWQQRADGVPALDSGLRANLTADGRLINVAGSPVSGIAAVPIAPRVNGAQARVLALGSVGVAARPSLSRVRRDARSTTTFRSGDRAALGVLAAATSHVVWDTIVQPDATHVYRIVIDARTGKTLLRRNLVEHAASASVHLNYPGAAVGGTEKPVTLPPAWIPNRSTKLLGPNAYVFADLNDNNLTDAGEDVPPTASNSFAYPLMTFASTIPGAPVGACTIFPCTWDPHTAASSNATRLRNLGQSGTQAFFFVNTFHDWLALPPISFTTGNGAFQDADPVVTKVLDGANLADPKTHLKPDTDHIDNADMLVLPDGLSPFMRMFLWHETGAPWTGANADPFLPANGADEADIVYHEYTHGLSNRLVVDSLGFSTLASHQAGSMGEAWSDWYAMDYLTDPASCGIDGACFVDTPGVADVRIGTYIALGKVGQTAIRFQAIDCPVGSADAVNCHSPHAGVPAGGLTYGSLGRIDGSPEVHSDGEIWAQTLWDLRTVVKPVTARRLITRAMELSPDDPSFLDMRNAILQADTSFNGAASRNAIWAVFAHRGMGYFAGTIDAADTHPVASFATPPAANAPQGSLSGSVIDLQTHAPVRGAHVSFAGLDSGFPGSAGANTSRTGAYRMRSLPVGTYPYLITAGGGYEPLVVRRVPLAAGSHRRDLRPRRGWALLSGGGRIKAFTAPDFSDFGCGPAGLIDGSLGSGWGSELRRRSGASVKVKLPAAINVSDVAIDPGPTCGDGPDAGTRRFQILTSRDGKKFTPGRTGHFTIKNQGHLNRVLLAPAARTKVRYVQIRAITNFGNFDPASKVRFIDVSEMAVHGTQVGRSRAVISGPRRVRLGRTAVYSSASSVGVGRSPIVRRTWSTSGARAGHRVKFRFRATRLGTIRLKLTVTDFRGRRGTVTKTITVVR